MKKFIVRFLLIFILLTLNKSSAQSVAVKTNMLYWASTTPNISIETSVSPKWTVELSGSINPWNFNRGDKIRKLQHWLVSAEGRHWIYEKFDGHFLGVHGFFGSYNAGGLNIPVGLLSNLKNNRYEGYTVGAGVSYGYQWYLGPHWNLEASAGVGYAYFNYERHDCFKCGTDFGKHSRHYFGPTKLGLSLVYLIKSKKY